MLNTYHMTKFAYFVDKLQKTPDGDGTLLDHSLVLYGSSLSDGNQHNFSPLPIVLAGGASGQLKGGRHLQFPKDTHMSNLLLAMLDKLGARQETFGDSTGDAVDLIVGPRVAGGHLQVARTRAGFSLMPFGNSRAIDYSRSDTALGPDRLGSSCGARLEWLPHGTRAGPGAARGVRHRRMRA